MSRLSRAEQQLRTRAKILAAARSEFATHGYRDTTIDRIAARATLTRGAVYSNFPSKRALYLSALTPDQSSAAPQVETAAADAPTGVHRREVTHAADTPHSRPEQVTPTAGLAAELELRGAVRPAGASTSRLSPARSERAAERRVTAADGLAGFAAAWLEREHPAVDVVPELAELGEPYAGLLGLNAVLLGLSLDRLEPGRLAQKIRVARLALTLLTGATQLTSTPGFIQPLAVVGACAHLASLNLDAPWTPPPTTPPIRPAHETWSPPSVTDEVLRRTADLDGVIVILGLNRLAAAEDVVRTTTAPTTIALVSSQPAELGPLARYTTSNLLSCLRQPPGVQLIHDETGVLASALGGDVIGDELEYAALVGDNQIIARAEGFGAAHAIARSVPQLTHNTRGR